MWTFYDKYGQKRVTSQAIITPTQAIVDVIVGRGNPGDPAAGAVVDTNTILGGAIPQTFRHLELIVSLRMNTNNNDTLFIQFNNDTATNYNSIREHFNSSGLATTQELIATSQPYIGTVPGPGGTGDYWVGRTTIPDYTQGSHVHPYHGHGMFNLSRTTGNLYNSPYGGYWTGTAAITRIVINTSTGTGFAAGSRVTLYGLP